jgi:HlyD family secretion protein
MRLIAVLLLAVILSACSTFGSPTPLPTIVLSNPNSASTPTAVTGSGNNFSGGTTASGVVVPATSARLALTLGGSVKAVPVAEGDKVEAGQPLLELDNSTIQLDISQAERALRELTSQASIAAAEQAVATSQKAVDDAQKKLNTLNSGRADQKAIDYYEAQLTLAKQVLDNAEAVWSGVTDLTTADPKRAVAETNLYKARKAYNAALATLNWAKGKPSDNDFATAQANLDAAKAAYQETQWYLAALKGETLPPEATGGQLAKLQQARDNFMAAQSNLDHSRLLAPFSGVVTATHAVPGEFVLPGQVLVELADVDHLQVETTDLSERDVTNVKVGQPVTISVDALPQRMTGQVVKISPVSDTLGGDVVYKTTIALDNPPPGLRSGMSVKVQFGQ